MKRLILFFPLFLFAVAFPNFRPCLEKYSFISSSIPITKNLSVAFDKRDCLYYDKFTGMCVFNSNNKKVVKFSKALKLGWWIASIKKDEIYVGNFAKDEVFFNPARFSVKSLKNSVISDIFCRAVGIGRGDGFIKGSFVAHFVKYGYWGDVGIDVDKDMNIISFDPFYVKGLRVGEKIKYINGKKADYKLFEKEVLLGVNGKKLKITTSKTFYVLIRKKVYLFTPLEYFGIKVDKNLNAYFSKSLKEKYFLGDKVKLIAINNHQISSFEDVKRLLSTYKNVTITIKTMGVILKIPLR
ncbi:MAG: hypothetical protein ABGX26_00070 [Nautiliaceae bacterium]